ncbi:hypothetical protein E2320_007173, partial [Naja naja]
MEALEAFTGNGASIMPMRAFGGCLTPEGEKEMEGGREEREGEGGREGGRKEGKRKGGRREGGREGRECYDGFPSLMRHEDRRICCSKALHMVAQ